MTLEPLPTKAEDMFCYGIYTTWHVINQSYTRHLKRLGLTYPQYIALTLLWESNNQKVTDLAARLRMATSTMTPLIKRLELNGLVVRSKGKRDRRETFVTLTPKGERLNQEAPNITACMIEATSLTSSELSNLQLLLDKLSMNLSEDLSNAKV